MTTVTKRVPPGAAADTTKRVIGAITESTTVRVPMKVIADGSLLLLETGEGALSVEGDSAGQLKLQGSY